MSENESKKNNDEPCVSPCRLESSQHEVPNASKLPEVLKEVFEEAMVAGIAWATNGTWRILKIGDATLEVSPPEDFELSRVYEARVWEVITDDVANDRLAHEFRWVNGVGSRELTLLSVSPDSTARSESGVSTDEASSPIGYAHRITYMQHDPHRGPLEEEAKPSMVHAIEFITEESTYGNLAVTDQLFTGK